jgi:hypothetical protein
LFAVLIVGYLSVSRAFAYVGIPTWKVFIGEVVLALSFLWGPGMNGKFWPWAVVKLPVLKSLSVTYALFFGFGILQVLHGIWMGNPPLVALRDFAFNYYPIYFFLGLLAGVARPDLLPRLIRCFAWFNGIYGVLFLLYLNRVSWFIPGIGDETTPIPIFGQPIYSFVALLGLLAYEKNLWRVSHLLFLNAFVMLGMQIRTEWLAFGIGVLVWGVITKQGKRLLHAGVIGAALLGMMYVTDFKLPSPEGRAEGDISVRQLADRAMAVFRADLSDESAAAGVGEADSQEATFVWRTVWWLAIWNSALEDGHAAVLGHGYGFPLGDLVPYLAGQFIRTPHNEFFFALGYTGWIGVALFFAFEVGILRLLWKVNRTTGEPFGVPFWVAMMAYGMFFPLGESPYGAIPFYLITGWIAARIVFDQRLAQDKKALKHPTYVFGAAATRPATVSP